MEAGLFPKLYCKHSILTIQNVKQTQFLNPMVGLRSVCVTQQMDHKKTQQLDQQKPHESQQGKMQTSAPQVK